MSISIRLLLGFGFTMLMMLGIGVFSVGEMADMRGANEAVVTRDMSAAKQIDGVHDAHAEMARLRLLVANRALRGRVAQGVVIQGGVIQGGAAQGGAGGGVDAAIAAWTRQSTETSAELDRARLLVADYASHITTGYARHRNWLLIAGMLSDLGDVLQHVQADTRASFAAMQSGDEQAIATTDAAVAADRQQFDGQMGRVDAALADSIALGQDRISATYDESVWSIVTAVALALVVSVSVSLLVRRAVIRPIGSLVGVAERIGGGDLSARASVAGAGEVARLGQVINRMVEGLASIAAQTREATGNLNVSVAEIRASTQEQAASVEQQLAAVQETAATVDEIAHSGSQISRRAQDVIATAQATQRASDNGLTAVRESGRAMEQVQLQGEAVAANIVALSEKTEAIGEIINSVNDISERSHLLALNAAIEAASAGEHGRSFAIVATEMKILADQARDATSQVRSILGDIQRGINTSVMLTEEAVKRGAAGRARTETAESTIEDMAAGIQDAVQTFQQIVASTNQQQLGIEQVMVALQNIRQASQQTAAGTRQLDSAALGLGELSRQLLATSDRFRT